MVFPFEYEVGSQYHLRKQVGSKRKLSVNPSAYADGTDLMFGEKANEELKKSHAGDWSVNLQIASAYFEERR
jgi:hypothetical protein